MQFTDGASFGAQEPVQPLDAQQAPPLPTLPPLMVSPEAAPPATPVEPPAVQPVPAEPTGVPVSDMRDVPLGTLVFRAGLLPEEHLEEALQEGMKTGKRLGEILLERGWVSEDALGRLLAAQKGLPFVELDPANIDPTAPPLLHVEKARLHGALPIGFQGGVPVVAVADPSNDLVVENVRRALACEPVFVVAGRDQLLRTIGQVYGGATETMEPAAEPAPAPEPVAAAPPVADPVFSVEPVAPAAPEPVAPAPLQAPVETPPVPEVAAPPVEPVDAVEPVQNGEGVWLGQPHEAAPVEPALPVQPASVEPVQQPAEPVATEVPAWPPIPEPAVVQPSPDPMVPVAPPAPPAEPVAAVEPVAAPQPPPEPQSTWSVVLRLADGERVEVGSFVDETQALEGARGVVTEIAAEGSWPFFAGRFIRPDVILSVDLVELEGRRWLGSSARAAAWAPGEQPGQ